MFTSSNILTEIVGTISPEVKQMKCQMPRCGRPILWFSSQRIRAMLSSSECACEQCGRAKIPVINKPENFTTYLEKIIMSDGSLKIILSPTAIKSLNEVSYNTGQDIKVLIGPEGGFSKKELELATLKNFLPIKIGPRILRTETAPISIMSILQYKYGDIV